MGKLAWIDLSRRSIEARELDPRLAGAYIGGSGLGARILYDETDAGTEPLGAENVLIFATGPLVGTNAPLSGRHQVVARSPLTGIYGESDCGGHWGTALKRAGFDALIVRGKADAPVYVWLDDGKIEIRDASHVWGRDTYEMDAVLKGETHRDAVVTGIGPAGERQVLLASVMADGKDGRTAGRCGLGAVMGSKRLKALVAHGRTSVPVADQKGLTNAVRARSAKILEVAKGTTDYGTAGFTPLSEKLGDLPIRNWAQGDWRDGAAKIGGEAMAGTILVDRYRCGACIIACGRTVRVDKGPYAPVDGGGPEYETVALIGANTLVDNLEAIARANELCNRYGMDTISVGAVIAFAMEAFEKGLISEDDTGGVRLEWGNPAAVLAMIEQIAMGEKVGKLLGRGVRHAAEALGGSAAEFAVHTKGLEFPAHDPRCFASKAVSYATSNRGACHLQSGSHFFELGITDPALGIHQGLERHEVQGKGELAAKAQNAACLFDSLKACKFLAFGGVGLGEVIDWYNFVTGRGISTDEALGIGERIFNLKRMYNVRLGVRRKDDTLPPRMYTPRPTGGSAGYVPDLETMLREYYAVRGWDDSGVPTPQTLGRLGLA
jgi:aldehyde:ferredoxin oxidoreductase